MKRKTKWVRVPISYPRAEMTVCRSLKQVRAAMKSVGDSEEAISFVTDGAAATTWFLPGDGGFSRVVICVRKGIDKVPLTALIVHEAVHIWQRAKDDMGEDRHGDEVEAYAIQAIVQELLENFF